jgi:monoamine oxidase
LYSSVSPASSVTNRFGGYEQAREGGVLFCGEHTSVDFQGFMEGAAAEGKRAARQLVSLLD